MAAPAKEHLVITAVGPDRVGLVEKIAQFLVARGCNIEDSKMAVFCGDFTVILLVSGPQDSLDKVSESLETVTAETGLTFYSRRPAPKAQPDSALPCKLLASCLDHPGVVHQLSSALSGLGVNIDSMETTTHEAPMSGAPIFQMEAFLSVPSTVNLHELRRQLDEIGKRENIDVEFSLLAKR